MIKSNKVEQIENVLLNSFKHLEAKLEEINAKIELKQKDLGIETIEQETESSRLEKERYGKAREEEQK